MLVRVSAAERIPSEATMPARERLTWHWHQACIVAAHDRVLCTAFPERAFQRLGAKHTRSRHSRSALRSGASERAAGTDTHRP